MGIVLGAIGLFVAVMVVLYWSLRRLDEQGHWDKEGHGTPEHQTPGVAFRPLEAPPKEPFN